MEPASAALGPPMAAASAPPTVPPMRAPSASSPPVTLSSCSLSSATSRRFASARFMLCSTSLSSTVLAVAAVLLGRIGQLDVTHRACPIDAFLLHRATCRELQLLGAQRLHAPRRCVLHANARERR